MRCNNIVFDLLLFSLAQELLLDPFSTNPIFSCLEAFEFGELAHYKLKWRSNMKWVELVYNDIQDFIDALWNSSATFL